MKSCIKIIEIIIFKNLTYWFYILLYFKIIIPKIKKNDFTCMYLVYIVQGLKRENKKYAEFF
jgi:hypothetical protein